MTHSKISSIFVAILLATLQHPEKAHASKLIVKNDDTATVDVTVEPGEGSILSSTAQIKQSVESGKEITIHVSKEQMGDVETFSVKGSVTMPSLYNRCSGLFLNRDYRIVFTGAKTGGTICYAEKLPPSSEGGRSKEEDNRRRSERDDNRSATYERDRDRARNDAHHLDSRPDTHRSDARVDTQRQDGTKESRHG